MAESAVDSNVSDDLPRRRFPCAECPWRTDTPPGQFEACRFDRLRVSSGRQGAEADLFAPMFACHKSPEGREEACAGWLAVAGIEHLGVRLAITQGRLPASALSPAPGWPELFESYDEMAVTQGRIEAATAAGTENGNAPH